MAQGATVDAGAVAVVAGTGEAADARAGHGGEDLEGAAQDGHPDVVALLDEEVHGRKRIRRVGRRQLEWLAGGDYPKPPTARGAKVLKEDRALIARRAAKSGAGAGDRRAPHGDHRDLALARSADPDVGAAGGPVAGVHAGGERVVRRGAQVAAPRDRGRPG